MNLMMLAAGEGTRLRPHTLTHPKPSIPFLNIPLAAWSLGFLGKQSINLMCVNTYHLPNKIHNLFKSLTLPTKNLYFSDEVGSILGSGGGLEKARKYFENNGPLIMMNSDEVILPEDHQVVEHAVLAHINSDAIATLMVTENPEVGTKFGGVWVDSSNKVIGFGKQRPEGAVKGWHFVGVQILSDSVFNFLPSDQESNILYDGLMAAIAAGHRVQVFPFNCLWFETGNPTDFLHATQECLKILADSPNSDEARYMIQVLNKFSASDWQIEKTDRAVSLLSKSSKVSVGSSMRGFVVVGGEATIEDQTFLEDCVVGPNVNLTSGSEIKKEIRL